MFYGYFNSPLINTAQNANTIWLQYNARTNYKGSKPTQRNKLSCLSHLVGIKSYIN